MSPSHLLALAALVLAAPRPAAAAPGPAPAGPDAAPRPRWAATFSFWGGISRYDVLGLAHAVGAVSPDDGKDLVSGNFDTIGGAVVLKARWLEVGGLYEGSLLQNRAHSEVFAAMGGAGLDLTDRVRLSALLEAGGHLISQIGSGNAFAAETREAWLPFLGIRPGLAYRIPVSEVRLVLGLASFARWDLLHRDVSIRTSSGPGTSATYDAGGTAFGVVAGLGLEL